jgi:hypothetical protein
MWCGAPPVVLSSLFVHRGLVEKFLDNCPSEQWLLGSEAIMRGNEFLLPMETVEDDDE